MTRRAAVVSIHRPHGRRMHHEAPMLADPTKNPRAGFLPGRVAALVWHDRERYPSPAVATDRWRCQTNRLCQCVHFAIPIQSRTVNHFIGKRGTSLYTYRKRRINLEFRCGDREGTAASAERRKMAYVGQDGILRPGPKWAPRTRPGRHLHAGRQAECHSAAGCQPAPHDVSTPSWSSSRCICCTVPKRGRRWRRFPARCSRTTTAWRAAHCRTWWNRS